MASSDRHNSDSNNEYIEIFQNIVRKSQSEGYYDAEWTSPKLNMSMLHTEKIKVAAQVVCNRTEFVGASYEMDEEVEIVPMMGPILRWRIITVKFNWS